MSDCGADLFLGVVDTFCLPFLERPLVRNTKLSVDSFLKLWDPSSDREPDSLSTDVGLFVLGRGFFGGYLQSKLSSRRKSQADPLERSKEFAYPCSECTVTLLHTDASCVDKPHIDEFFPCTLSGGPGVYRRILRHALKEQLALNDHFALNEQFSQMHSRHRTRLRRNTYPYNDCTVNLYYNHLFASSHMLDSDSGMTRALSPGLWC